MAQIHNVKEVMENDKIREEDIISFGIKVIRFTNKEVRTDISKCIGKNTAYYKRNKE